MWRYRILIFALFFNFSSCDTAMDKKDRGNDQAVRDPLASWNDGMVKTAILDFLNAAVDPTHEHFIIEEDRIAVFDNDGTLWPEKPMYFQLLFAFDYIQKNIAKHPELMDKEPFLSVINGDIKKVLDGGQHSLIEILNFSHANMSVDEFQSAVLDWIKTSHHPKYGKRYNELVYMPMMELIGLLKENGFKVFIVSGGGVDFMRVWAPHAYGIPSHHIIGSSLKTTFVKNEAGYPELRKEGMVNFIDDGAGKPVGIHNHIGKRPVFAAGNSDGDYEMLEYTSAGPFNGLSILLHHTDEWREFAYDRSSPVGKLDKALKDAADNKWLVIDMKKDWERVFIFE